ncbi:MAG: hypothetical protein PWQ77_2022 [Kosmotogales bacterium]|nr:hypothetical protein [Kosmotogales bacterium]
MKKLFEKQVFFKFVIYISIAITLFTISIVYIKNYIQDEWTKEIYRTNINSLNDYHDFFLNENRNTISDLLFLKNILEHMGNFSYEELQNGFLYFVEAKKIYDQVRYIDKNGNEIIRINYNDGNPFIVHEDELQNKEDRYYFIETIKLPDDSIYISPLDLNIENEIIEEPPKPMQRYGTPVYRDGEVVGIVVINYLAANLFDIFEHSYYIYGKTMLVNNDGYWLYHEDESKRWGFMYENEQISFSSEFEEEWYLITNGNDYIKTENGLFVIFKIPLEVFTEENVLCADRSWFLIDYISPEELKEIFNPLNTSVSVVIIFGIILIFVLGFFMFFLFEKRREAELKKEYFSKYDYLTNTYNRMYGMELLNEKFKYCIDNNLKFALVFVDLDNLKEINDRFGHERGDMYIKDVVKIIKNNLRKSDILTRVGGDEFIIYFYNCALNEAEVIWNSRIKKQIEEKNLEQKDCKYRLSHGTVECDSDANKSLDDYIRDADHKMYKEKREHKNSFNKS